MATTIMTISIVPSALFRASCISRASCSANLRLPAPSSCSSLHSSFVPPRTALASSMSSCLRGHSLPSIKFGSRGFLVKRSNILKIMAGKTSLGCTKRSKSRLSRARTSGFRARMQTPTGRKVLKRRRAKGRKRLVPATNPNSGKYA